MTLEYKVDKDNFQFVLHDLQGKAITKIQLVKGEYKQTIDERTRQSGFYIFKIVNDMETVYNGKIVIIK